MDGQTALFSGNPEYDAFLDKFKRKLTTDDCYTPDNVYNAVADWVAEEYRLDRACFVRPFYPGGDYQSYDYPPECVVVDNPPFSIYAQILRWYQAHGVRFFLFAPALTLFSRGDIPGVCYLPIGANVTYENGAIVRTSFATNLDKWKIRTVPALYERIKAANAENERKLHKALPKYEYPAHIITAALAQKWCHYGVEFKAAESDCANISALDAQRKHGKAIFGGGFLLSDSAAAERAAAERAAAVTWKLSARERETVRRLGREEI